MANAKRKISQRATHQNVQLKPLNSKQIAAVTQTYNDLRAAGVDSVVELPATVVAGDTSSGKSSVMSRLTGLKFPRGDGVVTKFATEVEMRPADKDEVTVSILPDMSRPDGQRDMLLRYKREILLDDFEAVFEDASYIMAQFASRTLYADVLKIVLKGPSCRPLTVIDLPGLIQATTEKVTEADRKLSEMLAKRYVGEKRTIVLAVISAANEVVNQAITRMTRDVDKTGQRTMGIVTKVDTVLGKAKDASLQKILKNDEIALKLGWHALVNTIEEEPNATEDEITKAEQNFFKQRRFINIDQESTGIDNLRSRVVQVVGQKLVETLPALQDDVQAKLDSANRRLSVLGSPVSESSQQKRMLSRLCGQFKDLAQAELDGGRNVSRSLNQGSGSTLRSEIEDLHTHFAQAMRSYGSTLRFTSIGRSSLHIASTNNPYHSWMAKSTQYDRVAAINKIKKDQKECKGGLRTGAANNHIVSQLFLEMSDKRWADIACNHLETVANKCKERIQKSMLDRTTKHTQCVSENLQDLRINDYLDRNLETAFTTLKELEKDRHTTLKTMDPRLEDLVESKIKELQILEGLQTQTNTNRGTTTSTTGSTETLAAISNLAHVVAYYEIDLEYWITAITKQVIERFVCCVPEAVSADLVFDLSDKEIKAFFEEPEALTKERKMLGETVGKMEYALAKLGAQVENLG